MLFFAVFAVRPLWATDAVVMKAMQEELARSMSKLQLENLPKPYFISYRIQDSTGQTISGCFGALLGNNRQHTRTLSVEVRVGDYKFDDTNLTSPLAEQVVQIPVEDDDREIRRQLWLATDAAYKRALQDLSRKKAALEAAHLSDDTPDFSQQQPTHLSDDQPPVDISPPEWEKMVRRLSALFREMPQVENSTVVLGAENTHILYVNSEGTSFTRTEPVVSFVALASGRAPDGMPLPNYEPAYGRSMQDIPAEAELARRIRTMGEDIKREQAAPLAELYNGPVLFETDAAARLFSQTFAGKLLGRRRPLGQANEPDPSFLDKIGARVLPDFLSVVDDPTLSAVGKTQLLGGWKVDDEGVRARRTELVSGGYLKTLLTTRDPVRGITASTGNDRGSGPMPSNLIVTADKGLTSEQIKEQLVEMVKRRGKPYGILVDHRGFDYKVYPDGHQELVRRTEMPSLTAEAFRDILAATRTLGVFHEVYRTTTGAHLMSFVAPSLLFEDVTVRKSAGEIPKLPVAKNPFFDK